MKYFDIETPVKKMNGWERSLLELKNIMRNGKRQNVGNRTNTTTPRTIQKNQTKEKRN